MYWIPVDSDARETTCNHCDTFPHPFNAHMHVMLGLGTVTIDKVGATRP